MRRGAVAITGIARHSLGEALAREFLGRAARCEVIGIDRLPNADLVKSPRFRQILFDINPLNYRGGLETFSEAFAEHLSREVASAGTAGVECLVQCAGTYDSGEFLQYSPERRGRVLGVNVLGVTEVLHAVMHLNCLLGRRNRDQFKHVLIGSFHGLRMRAGRSLYGSSKAFGIDLCASLVAGGEIEKCLYIAPGPIDTPMLHRNHWVTRAGGSESFFDRVYAGPADQYIAIFVDCDESVLEIAAREEFGAEVALLRASMAKYRDERRRAHQEQMGVLSRVTFASVLVDVLRSPNVQSGVYLLCADRTPAVFRIIPFSDVDRIGPS